MKAPTVNTTAVKQAEEISFKIIEDINANFTRKAAEDFLSCVQKVYANHPEIKECCERAFSEMEKDKAKN